jgi:uncharacterized protein (TIGR03118 family)
VFARRPVPQPACRLVVERLDGRCLPSAGAYLQTNLVSDIPGLAAATDPNLINPWGIVFNASSPFWVSDNNAGVSTLYNGQGQKQALTVSVPGPTSLPKGTAGTPTGVAASSGTGFVVTASGKSGPARFIFATEDGVIAGWNPTADGTHAILAVDNPNTDTGAVYKGLAIGTDASGQTRLYAANFRAGTIDVFGSDFKPVKLAGSFQDAAIPAGFAPFDVQVINNKLYVTYAKQNDAKHDDVAGPGNGFVDVFNLDGTPGLANGKVRLISGGTLNSPWGLAVAPGNFGAFSNDLLVGNFGDGRINAFDPATGAYRGSMADADAQPLHIKGLWGLSFGNDANAGAKNTLFFTAGIEDESHGLFGMLQPTTLHGPPPLTAVGVGAGGPPVVKVYDASGALRASFLAYASNFRGGVRVAVGDVNGDGVPDIVTAPGPSGGPQIKVFDGAALLGGQARELTSFFAFDSGFMGGVNVAAGDVNGDGFADIIVGADAGGGPNVKVFSGAGGSVLANFFAYDPGFTGGVRVAAGDIGDTGAADIITGAGAGGGPHVKVFDGSGNLLQSFFAFDPAFTGGVNVAAGDVNGDGKDDIVVAAGTGGGPHVKVFDGSNFQVISSFFAYDPGFTGGVQVAARDVNNDGKADIITGAGAGGGPHVVVRDGQTQATLESFFAFDPTFMGGVFVG